MSSTKETRGSINGKRRHQALDLISRQSTLVLATRDINQPWAAPVYYVYDAPAFYFFSSPHSTHMEQAMVNPINAAALFSDPGRWDQIEGIQMVGRIEAIQKKIELVRVTARYLHKFPWARKLLSGKEKGGLDLSAKAKLYAFHPQTVYYLNNQMGFGSRVELSLV